VLTKLLDVFLGKIAGHLVDYLSTAIESIFYETMKKYELSKVASVEKELIKIETELKLKPRITENEASDIARRLNDARNRL